MTEEAPAERETRLICEHMGLVVSIAKKFNPRTREEQEDLVQAGLLGLLKAIRKYDETKAVLTTWAYRPIRWEIINHLSKNQPVGVSINSVIEPSYVMSQDSISDYLPESLQDDEREMLVLVCAGYNVKEISRILELTEYGVSKLIKLSVDKIQKANGEKTHINGQ